MNKPDWSKTCACGATVNRYRGQVHVFCSNCSASYNAAGQRLRDGWMNNPSWGNDDIGDMEGYELQMLRDEE